MNLLKAAMLATLLALPASAAGQSEQDTMDYIIGACDERATSNGRHQTVSFSGSVLMVSQADWNYRVPLDRVSFFTAGAADDPVHFGCEDSRACIATNASDDLRNTHYIACANPERVVRAFEHLIETREANDPFAS